MPQTNLMGKVILGYTVTEKLGSGAFGTVYKVQKENPSGLYVRALKHITIPTEKQYNSVLNSMGGDVSKADNYFSEMLKSIVSEIKILNVLAEKGVPNIVRYYENDIVVNESPRRYDVFILMEYLTPLEDYISQTPFLIADVGRLGEDILRGLISCHENGVIHRDIKDDNIFVSETGEYKIGDFGVSKVLKDSSKAESLKGTPNYLAPEVYLGKEGYTKSVDLYSLGIVLYRLLNYNRNPFLPHFPEQFFSQDEDAAFEARMSGKVPDYPSLGGDLIGEVLVKAISEKGNRFQNASDFLSAWEYAISNTPDEIMKSPISFTSSLSGSEGSEHGSKEFKVTLGESPLSREIAPISQEQKREQSINKHLFESVGELPQFDVPDVDPVSGASNEMQNSINGGVGSKGRLISAVPPINEPHSTIEAVDKKVLGKYIFLIPIAILLIGIIAYFVVLPSIYGKIVSFIDWLFTDPQNIMDTLREPGIVLPKINSIIGLRIFWWLWLAGFIASLFFVGKQLQTKPQPNASNAIFIKKEPYLAIQDLSAKLKVIGLKINNREFDDLCRTVKLLEERLSIESDFGYGKGSIISCENNIAEQIQFLLDSCQNLETDNMTETVQAMNIALSNINSLLRRRIELKKK